MQQSTNTSTESSLSNAAWLAICLLTAVAGYAIGRISTPEAPQRPATVAVAGVVPSRVATEGEIVRALANPNAFARAAWLATELPKYGPEIVPEIRYALQSLAVDRGPVELELLLRRWAAEDPALAFQWALTQAPRSYRDGLIAAGARVWASQDPQAALQEISTLPSGPSTQAAIWALVQGWFDSGQPGLEQYLYDIGYGVERQRGVAAYLRSLILRDGSEAATQYAESVSEEDERFKRTVMRQAASEITKVDPSLGVAWEAKHGSGRYGSSLLGLVGIRWSVQDGPAAMAWLSEAEPGARRDSAVEDAFRGWRQRDRASLLKWVDEMGIDGVEDWFVPAVGMYAMALSVLDPQAAMKWTELMPDEGKRIAAQVTIARRWRSSDPDAADRWLAQSSLSDEARANSLQPLPVKKSKRSYFEKLPPRE